MTSLGASDTWSQTSLPRSVVVHGLGLVTADMLSTTDWRVVVPFVSFREKVE